MQLTPPFYTGAIVFIFPNEHTLLDILVGMVVVVSQSFRCVYSGCFEMEDLDNLEVVVSAVVVWTFGSYNEKTHFQSTFVWNW